VRCRQGLRSLLLFPLVACASAPASPPQPPAAAPVAEHEFTVGLVQKEIRVGMSQTDVAVALGSPNIVTRDSEGREAWVYDKIATEASYSNTQTSIGGAGSAAGAPGPSLILGILTGGRSKQTGSSRTTQRTLTVVIRFDGTSQVESFSYHASKF
jgi:hypothetical protein